MKTPLKLRHFLLAFSCLVLAASFTSCKKGDTAVPNTQFFLNAAIGSTAFRTSTVVATLSTGEFLVIGYTLSGNDTTAVLLGFPQTTPLNQATAFDNKTVGLGYIDSKNSADFYVTNPILNPGSVTISSINMKDSTISGSFNGTLIDSNLKTIVVTAGSFNTKFTMKSSQPIIPPGGSKR